MDKQVNAITFDNMPKVVAEVHSEVSIIRSQLEELKSLYKPSPPTEYLTRKEVADLLKCDLSTIHNWTKKGKLTKYCFGARTYYKRAEIELALKPI